MKTLTKQDFLDIYKNNGNALATKEAKALAVKYLQEKDIPNKKDEEWRKTDINPILRHGYKYGERIELDKTIVSMYNLSGTYSNVIVFINGHFCHNLSKFTDSKENFELDSIKNAKKKHSDIFEKYFNKTKVHNKHYFSALNTAFAEDGAFILIKKNKKVENPIHIYHFSDGNDNKITSLLRNMVYAEQGSKANVLFSFHSLSDNYELTNVATEIFLGKDSYVDFNIFQGEGNDAFQINSTFVEQKKGSQFYFNTATMCGALVRNDIDIKLLEEDTFCDLAGLYMPDREQNFDNTITIEHTVGHSLSKQFYRGILDNNARANFSGTVLIPKNAIKSEAHQTNNNILLSKHSKVHSKPQLIIHNDDVAASHGSTVGQLNNEEVFYMQARGIGVKKARTLLLTAFADEVINKIQIPQYHFYIKYLVEKRLSGEKIDAMCTKMGVCRK